jgi:hypothetical protein
MFPDLTRKEMSNKNTKCGFKSWFSDLSHTFAAELRAIFGDMGVMLFFFVLPLCYPIVYTLIYYPQIVTEMPVAVVDNSRTEMSRRLVRSIDASPSVKIYQYCNNMSEAKALFAENKVYGIVEIPSDYERKIQRGEQASVPFYAEMSLLLRYRAFLSALTEVQKRQPRSPQLACKLSEHRRLELADCRCKPTTHLSACPDRDLHRLLCPAS